MDACRSAFAGNAVVSAGTVTLTESGVPAIVRVVESTEGVETLSGEYTVSTDGGLTYSAPADVDGGASVLETAVEQAIGRMAHATDLTATDTTVTDAGNLLRNGDVRGFNSLAKMYTTEHALTNRPQGTSLM